MEELKDELGQYEVEVQTDGELIQELWTKYRESTISDEEKIEILEDLEYYLHQVNSFLVHEAILQSDIHLFRV